LEKLKLKKQNNMDNQEAVVKAITKILDFVERHNKQDKEQDVAESAAFLEKYFDIF
jgi:hypothetical protein